MFTWICPQCGHEVPPSYSECPNCAAGGTQPAAAEAAPPPPPPQPTAPRYAPPPQYAPPAERRGFPAWLAAILIAGAMVGVLGGVYYLLSNRKEAAAPPPAPPAVERAREAVADNRAHPYAKFVEVTGLRIQEEKAKAKLQFAVVNHSAAEMTGLELKVLLRATSAKPEDPPIATFIAKVGNLGAFAVKDLETPLETKLRAYELPDWTFLRAEFEITAPK